MPWECSNNNNFKSHYRHHIHSSCLPARRKKQQVNWCAGFSMKTNLLWALRVISIHPITVLSFAHNTHGGPKAMQLTGKWWARSIHPHGNILRSFSIKLYLSTIIHLFTLPVIKELNIAKNCHQTVENYSYRQLKSPPNTLHFQALAIIAWRCLLLLSPWIDCERESQSGWRTSPSHRQQQQQPTHDRSQVLLSAGNCYLYAFIPNQWCQNVIFYFSWKSQSSSLLLCKGWTVSSSFPSSHYNCCGLWCDQSGW